MLVKINVKDQVVSWWKLKPKTLDKSVPKDFVDSLCELHLKSIPEAHYNSADLQPIGDRINGIFLNVTDMYVAKICGENIPVFSMMLLSLDDADSGKMPLCEPVIYGLYTKKYGFYILRWCPNLKV